jgi:cobalamin biosynthesis Mg chelatase CobN
MSDSQFNSKTPKKAGFEFFPEKGIAPVVKWVIGIIVSIVGVCAFLFGRDKDIRHATTPAAGGHSPRSESQNAQPPVAVPSQSTGQTNENPAPAHGYTAAQTQTASTEQKPAGEHKEMEKKSMSKTAVAFAIVSAVAIGAIVAGTYRSRQNSGPQTVSTLSP